VDEARVHGASVVAVHAWHYPYVGGLPSTPVVIDFERIAADAHQVLDAAIDEVDAGGVSIEPELVQGGAAQALLDAAKDADLLVVGSRGLGGFGGLLLGSVSQQVSHHARCPVVIVPHEE
jgi:nucleotide-binding universal stress UspA family protein